MASFQQNERERHPQSAAGSSPWHGSHGAGDMAEVPVTCLLGSLGPLLQRLEVLMDSEGNLPRGVNKSDLRHLRRDLEEVARSVIEISREENPHFTDKLWVKEVRELSYDAEDYLDMMLNSASGIRQIPWIQKRQKGPWIAKDISDLRSRLQQARDRRHRYQPVKAKLHTEHIGLDEPMDTVVKLLDLDKEPNLKVVPIFGVAGVGKTTLATRLYHHYGGSFHRRAFLRVSRKPDIRRLLTSMLSQIKGPKPCTDVQDLINNIRTCLEDKSYFIILDDLWDTPVWDIISHAFPASKCYSRIITTTEIERVALACCSYHTKDVYTMDPLNPNEAQKLLLSRAIGSEDECHGEELKDVSDAIIKNSDGLPLAIIPMASMLASWSKNVTEHKKYIQETLRLHATSEWMKEILNLVYSDLPDHLKTCLLYFNMYPEDYVIRKDDLVKQWVAEGFLSAVKLQDMEQVAGIYFDELMTRGMIQPLETNSNDEVLSCAVHHMVLDLIACKSTEENFITVMYHSETVTGLPDKVRRLSLKFGAAESARVTGSFRMSQVRSLVFSGFFRSVPSLVEYRLLQVLILHIWSDQDKTNFNLSRIQEMFRLRYLKVESNMTVKLPASIAGLQCLGTMEIDAIVTAIPWDIVHLQRLLHLRLPSGTHLPHGIGHLTSLRSLSYLNIGTSSRENVLDLNKLTNLHDLHLTCSQVRSKRLHSNMKLLGSILGSINLRSLTLDGGASSDDSIHCESLGSVSSDFCPPFLLETLKLSPGIFIFFHIPKWVGELSKLCVLKIAVKKLSSDDVDTLKELPALSALSLYVQVTPEKVVIDKNGFPVLKNFKFICTVLCVEFMSGAMSNVRRLKLGFSAYTGLEQCSGLEHLESLSVVYAKVEGAGVDESRRKAIQSQLKDIFKTSPVFLEKKTSPVVNVVWVDRVFGEHETHPGSRPATSLSGAASLSTTNPVEGEERKCTDGQAVIIFDGPDEQVFSEKGLKEDTINPADKRIYCASKESSLSTPDPEDDRGTGAKKEVTQTTNGQDDMEDESRVGHGPRQREPGDATKERGGSMNFTSIESSLNLQYPAMEEQQSLEKQGAVEMNPEDKSGSRTVVLHYSSPDVSVPDIFSERTTELHSGHDIIVEVVEVPVMSPTSKTKLPTTTEQTQDITPEETQIETTEDTQIETTVEQKQEITGQKESTPTSYRLMMELRKYILLLASLVATVTYAAGFSPPGDVWKDTAAGHISGDPIIRDTNYKRYMIYYYCNSTAFAASLVINVLVLILASLDKKDNNSSKIVRMMYKNSPIITVRLLQVVMVVDLLSLMGAYAAGTCRDKFTTVYSSVLVGFVFFYVIVQVVVASCFTGTGSGGVPKGEAVDPGHAPALVASDNNNSSSGSVPEAVENEEQRQKAKERFRKVLMLLATFAVSITYLAGLRTPGAFWDSTGASHRPGDPILKDHYNTRLAVFFGFNTMAFVASLLIIVKLLDSQLREKKTYGFIVVMLVSLISAYNAGSCRQTNTTVYMFTLIPAVLAYIAFLSFVADHIHDKWKAHIHGKWKAMIIFFSKKQSAHGQESTDKEKAANKAQSLVLLLATLAATVTYHAALDPPGGVWQDNSGGHTAGDPILLTTNAPRYKVFFYCNSVSLVASLLTIVLVQKKLLLKHHMLDAAMLLDLIGLIGAYVAGSTRDVSTSVYTLALIGAIFAYLAIHVFLSTLDKHTHTRTESDEIKEKEFVEKTRKRLLLFAILAATITYQTGLTPPGGFLLQDDKAGHHAGNPVLLYNFRHRYTAFFYCNSVSFMLSIYLIIILLKPNLYRPAIRSHALFVCMAACLFGLMGAYAAGCTIDLKISIYIYVLVAVVISFVVLLSLVFWFTSNSKNTTTTQLLGAGMETNTEDAEVMKEKGIHAKRKYLMLLGILVASVTYKAGLEPPGGFWKTSSGGYEAGNPIMHDIRRPRYLVFFYSNSTSFMASIVIILLLLVREKLLGKHKAWPMRWLVAINTTIVLDLLGLLVAYGAGSNRKVKTSVYFFLLVMTMPVIVATACIGIHHLLSRIRKAILNFEEKYNQRLQRIQV